MTYSDLEGKNKIRNFNRTLPSSKMPFQYPRPKRFIYFIFVLTAFLFMEHTPLLSKEYNHTERRRLQKTIIDYRPNINPRFKKIKRRKTKYIIIHTSEAGLKSTLRTVSRGKRLKNKRMTTGGHAHYVISRKGQIYRTLDKKYKADHAGLSMWNGETNISRVSIGIELVGYHYTNITVRQYRAVGVLLDILKRCYGLSDRDILTHSQIAYGKPNRWFKREHRGRKRCAKNFERAKAHLNPSWPYDPDVKSKRLQADPKLATLFYKRNDRIVATQNTNIITPKNTAWSIAGEDFNSPTTLYRLPNGKTYSGDQIDAKNGWSQIPAKTIVFLNQEDNPDPRVSDGIVKNILNGLTAWSHAGALYKHNTTIYFFPDGKIKNGTQISDWDDLPVRTQLIIGYRGPYRVTSRRPASKIAGQRYKSESTLYYYPNRRIIPGNQIKDFKRLPERTLVFLPVSHS